MSNNPSEPFTELKWHCSIAYASEVQVKIAKFTNDEVPGSKKGERRRECPRCRGNYTCGTYARVTGL